MLSLGACNSAPEAVQLAGKTMGTTWHVTYIDETGSPDQDVIEKGIARQLADVNQSMSTYIPDSEISRFNASAVGEAVVVSAAFSKVLATALRIGVLSEGAYDVTVAPLVSLWGFGAGSHVQELPSEEAIAQGRALVGQEHVRIEEGGALRKLAPVSLDFSSLAKGYGVDVVAQWLLEEGVTRFLVEVGGEMRLAGASGRGDAWHIAIEQPESIGRAVAGTMNITDRAVATSGDYRNFFEVNGTRYSHSIDPRTGYPVAHDLVSVTVVHTSAMEADAWATALTVLGPERAMAIATAQKLAVYLIRRTKDGYTPTHSPGFEAYLLESTATASAGSGE